jgi:hypothetical protein
LVAVVGASPEPVASFTESLQELESAVIRIDQRLAEIRNELATITNTTINKDDLTAALSAFGPVWAELYPAEKTRVVNLLIKRVEYDGGAEKIHINFQCLS